jgi:hypothetical protein
MKLLIQHAGQTVAAGHIDALVAYPDARDPHSQARFLWFVLRGKEGRNDVEDSAE